MTDSERVPWGKGEKNPVEGSEIDLKPYAYKESERVAYCALLFDEKFFQKNILFGTNNS